MAIAARHNLKVIEDNAQAFGAAYKGQKTGAIGHIACLSFFPSKNLGAYGDAGMITTNDDLLAEKMRMLRVHGWKKKYYPEILGYNSRLDELQAAVLRVKLKHLDHWNAKRRELAAVYNQELAGSGVTVPFEASDRTHVYHLYIVRSQMRNELKQKLFEQGIASEIYYPQPLHLAQPCRGLGWGEGSLPVSEQASLENLAIPIYPELSAEHVDRIISAIY